MQSTCFTARLSARQVVIPPRLEIEGHLCVPRALTPLHHGLSDASCARALPRPTLGHTLGHFALGPFGIFSFGAFGSTLGPAGRDSLALGVADWAAPPSGDRRAPARAALAGRGEARRTPRGCHRGVGGAPRLGAASGPRAGSAPGRRRGCAPLGRA